MTRSIWVYSHFQMLLTLLTLEYQSLNVYKCKHDIMHIFRKKIFIFKNIILTIYYAIVFRSINKVFILL